MGVRQTNQRAAIRTVLGRAGRPVGPAEMHAAAQQEVPGLGIATVYRAIREMTETGELVQVDVPGQAARYELAGAAHHHHFHCRRCNRAYCLEGCRATLESLTPPGFLVEGHELSLYGLCPNCLDAGAARDR